jgi:hypothetical protein
MGGAQVGLKNLMHAVTGLAIAVLLPGCGPDALTAAGSAATSAAVAAKQAEQQKAMADQKIKAMQEALRQHDRNMSEQVDPAPDREPATR